MSARRSELKDRCPSPSPDKYVVDKGYAMTLRRPQTSTSIFKKPLGKSKQSVLNDVPAPNIYNIKLDLVKEQKPKFTMSHKPILKTKEQNASKIETCQFKAVGTESPKFKISPRYTQFQPKEEPGAATYDINLQ